MKQKDIALIAIVAIISGVISIILSGMFLSSPEDRKQEVEVVEALSSEFDRPPKDYFNDRSVNPTKTIQIGEDPDSKPFGEN